MKKNSRFRKNILLILKATVVTQILAVAVTPILSRIYSPENFGTLAIYLSLVSVFATISTMRYEMAIPLSKTEDELAALVKLSTLISFLVSTLILITIFSTNFTIFHANKIIQLAIPIGLISISFYNILNYLAIKREDFNSISKSKILITISTIFIQVIFFKFEAVSLIYAQAFGYLAGFFYLYKSLKKPESRPELRTIFYQAKTHRNFPLYTSWAALLNALSTHSPSILIAYYFSPTLAGYYFLAHKVTTLPMMLLGQAVGQSFYLEAASNTGKLKKLQIALIYRMTLIAAIPFVTLVFFSESIFSILLGSNWTEAGKLAGYLSIMALFQLIASPISQSLVVAKNQKTHFIGVLIFSILRFVSLAIGVTSGNIYYTVLFYSIFSAIGYSLIIYLAVFKNEIIPHK